MHDYRDETYGDRIAEIYDSWYAAYDPHCIDLLAELANGGPALELGIGTGRIAPPLSKRGVRVHGVDGSGYRGQAPEQVANAREALGRLARGAVRPDSTKHISAYRHAS